MKLTVAFGARSLAASRCAAGRREPFRGALLAHASGDPRQTQAASHFIAGFLRVRAHSRR